MLLIDTAPMMMSEDYHERFRAEYHQLKIRYEKLENMVNNWDDLDFNPTCSKDIYMKQLTAMWEYMDILKYRADKEGIIL